MRHTDVQIPDQGGDEPDPSPTNEIDPDEIYDEGYYVAVINTANEADKWGPLFQLWERRPSMGRVQGTTERIFEAGKGEG